MTQPSHPGDALRQAPVGRAVPMEPKRVDPVCTVHAQPSHGATAAALELADLVEAKPQAVLGLATGNTMVEVYSAFVAECQRRGLDLSGITTFNLDEFVDLPSGDERSFRSFMRRHLHGPLGIDDARAMFPDQGLAAADATEAARRYEEAVRAAGGIDLQLLGLGRNGHVAFNEPGSSPSSRTRVVQLHEVTRADAAASFGGLDATPSSAITMGIATILEARALRVLAFGSGKAEAVRQLVEGDESLDCPCTFLRGRHTDLGVHLDTAAAGLLT